MNQHPAAMFEVAALNQKAVMEFYSFVFGWS
jgi:predicted enzyme related to lactoylglutathione lyase